MRVMIGLARYGCGALVWGLMLAVTPAAAGGSDGPMLEHPLRLQDAQEGIVGETGRFWIIEPSGAWRVAGYVNDDVQEPKRTGQLNPQALEVLADCLAREDLSALPATAGAGPPVNARRISLSYGDKVVTLTLAPDPMGNESIPEPDPGAGPAELFVLTMAARIVALTTASRSPMPSPCIE
jgi:hypothetical protein